MPYATKADPRARAITLASVAALHALGLAAILAAFAGGLVTRLIDHEVHTFIVPTPQPTKPQPTHAPRDAHQPRPMAQIHPIVPFPQPTAAPTQPPLTGNTGPQPLPTADPQPQPQPTRPSFAPKSARALGNPGDWVTTGDYPSAESRDAHEGITGFSLSIGGDGRVNACVVTRSSGWPVLDSAACRLITHRARFTPASDETGETVAGSYAGAVRWVMPPQE